MAACFKVSAYNSSSNSCDPVFFLYTYTKEEADAIVAEMMAGIQENPQGFVYFPYVKNNQIAIILNSRHYFEIEKINK